MVCHPHVLPESSTSSSSIRPINLQPTANQASHLQTHHTHKPKPPSPSSDHRFATSNLYNPETAPHFPWVSSSPWPQITHHTHKPTNIEPRSRSSSFLLRPPRNGAQFAMGLIQPMAHQLRRCPKVYCSCLSLLHSFPPFESGLKGFRLDVRQRTIPSFLQGSTLAVEYIAHVIGRCCC